MAIPNTTPTPNELYNGEMKKMSDTELRVVLIVTRATLGWEVNHETGMRKQEDWLSKSQLIKKTGRGSTAITNAIEGCIKHKWVEARDKDGELLNTASKREKNGGKIFYRLGQIFLERIQPIHNVNAPHTESGREPIRKVNATKETHTKEKLTKDNFISSNKKKPYYDGYEMRFTKKNGKWWVLMGAADWKEFGGKESEIEWK